jgi:hypothetical protein
VFFFSFYAHVTHFLHLYSAKALGRVIA